MEEDDASLDEQAVPTVPARSHARRPWVLVLVGVLVGAVVAGSGAYLALRSPSAPDEQRSEARPAAAKRRDEVRDEFQMRPVRMTRALAAAPGWRVDEQRSMPASIYLVRGTAMTMVSGGTFSGDMPTSEPDVESLFYELVSLSQDVDRAVGVTHWNDLAYTTLDNERRPSSSLDFRMEVDGVRYVGTYTFELDADVRRYAFIAVVDEGRRRTKAFDRLMFDTSFEVTDRFFSPDLDESRFVPLARDELAGASPAQPA